MKKEYEFKRLKELLNSKKLDLNSIRYMLKKLDITEDENKYEYYKALLEPETHSQTKIPSKSGVPSVVFQLKSSCKPHIYSYEGYSAVFKITPFFLIYNDFERTQLIKYIYRDQVLFYTPFNAYQSYKYNSYSNDPPFYEEYFLNQCIEPGIYDSYRLVSAAVHVKNIGALKATKGVIGGGIALEQETKMILCHGRVSTGTYEYSLTGLTSSTSEVIQRIRNMVYTQENSCLEGLRMLYFPVDKSYMNFHKIPSSDDIKWSGIINNSSIDPYLDIDQRFYEGGFNWYIYFDQVADGMNFLIDVYCNYECTLSPRVLNYMPVSVINNYVPEEMLNEIYIKIRNNCINKLK